MTKFLTALKSLNATNWSQRKKRFWGRNRIKETFSTLKVAIIVQNEVFKKSEGSSKGVWRYDPKVYAHTLLAFPW